MRIAYVIDSLGHGGAERSLAAMAPHLVVGGIDLHVVILHEREGHLDEVMAAGATVHSLASTASRRRQVMQLRDVLRTIDPVLVHTTLYDSDVLGRIAARLVKAPVVSSLVNELYGPEHRSEYAGKQWRVLRAQLVDVATARLVTRFHAISTSVADVMSRRLRVPRDRIDVVPRGRDRAVLGTNTAERREAARGALGLAGEVPVVLNVARHVHQKGQDTLLRAWPATRAAVPDAVLLLAGSGERTPALQELAEQLGIRDSVRFLGTRSDVPDLLCAADVFAFPSRREGLGGAVIEAMAMSVPIVATRIGPLRDAIPDERYAHLVPVDEPVAFAAGLAKTLLDREYASAMGSRCRERFDASFSIEAVTERMIEFYHRSLT